MRPKGSHEIEIEEFVDLDDIDPLYFEQPYYLVPDKRGEKPYALLVDAMQSLNKVAIGRVVMRSKERLVAIRPIDGALCVETMRYADEVVPVHDLVPETDAELSEKERTMARQLVESLAAEGFEPEKYHDQYREQLLDLIARKESGAEIVAEPQTEPPAKVLDLVAALEASIAKSKTAKDRHPTGAATRAKASREDERRRQARDEVDGEAAEGAGGEEGGARQAQRLTATKRAGGIDAPARGGPGAGARPRSRRAPRRASRSRRTRASPHGRPRRPRTAPTGCSRPGQECRRCRDRWCR